MMAENLNDTWDACIATSQAIFRLTRDAVDPVAKEHGLGTRGFLFTLINAKRAHPKAISAEKLHQLFPYGHPNNQANILDALGGAGWLNQLPDDEYHLSAEGEAILDQIQQAFYAGLAKTSVLPEGALLELASLFHELVESSMAVDKPEEKPRLILSRSLHPPASAGALTQIDQHLDDLGAFRDDSHIAAWRPHDVAGIAWEAFTFVWRGAVHEAAGLAERLQHRGYDQAAYAVALEQLVARGWLAWDGERCRLTQSGRRTRQEVEDLTNEYFFTPWRKLGAEKIARFQSLLGRLHKGLTEEPAGQTV